MNRFVCATISAALLISAAQMTAAKDISLNDLPAPAKRVADTEATSSGTLKRVEKVEHKGQTIYALTYQRADGSNKYIYLRADGTYVRDQDIPAAGTAAGAASGAGAASAAGAVSTREVQLNQLPEAVQRTIQTETRNGPVARITQRPHSGNTMYEVVFRQTSGQEKTIYLNPDGTYVKGGAAATAASTPAKTGRSWDALGTGSRQTLSSATDVNFNQLPPAVQNAFRSQAGASRIQNLQSGQLNGKQVYQAEVDRNGRKVQVRVDSAGTVLNPLGAKSSSGTIQP